MSIIDTNKCLADDYIEYKYKYHFFDKFDNINIESCEKIYSNAGLPDPDSFSEILYDFYAELWNLNKLPFKVKKIWNGYAWELVGTGDYNLRLGTDSIMSIYWHRIDMRKFICELIKSKNNDLKIFIREYLQIANTIGGFVLFPRHVQSINQRRGANSKIGDRFDLTLECIRRYYEETEKSEKDSNYNPLFGGVNTDYIKEDKEFFELFGKGKAGFEKYTEFFCLNGSWVKNGQVLNLLNNQLLDEYDFGKTTNPLPTENNWWTFYRNIMDRLEARNQQIKEIIEGK